MGGGVGLTIGFIFGSYSILRYALLCFPPLPHPHFRYLRSRSHARTKGWCRPSRLPCHSLAVYAQQRRDILVFPCYRIGANEFLTSFPSPSCPRVTPRVLLHLHLNYTSLYECSWLTYSSQVIRSDSLLPPHIEAARLQLLPPVVRARAEGATLIHARWAAEHQKSRTQA